MCVCVCVCACVRVRACVKVPSLQFPYAPFAWLLPGDCICYDATVHSWLGNNKQLRPYSCLFGKAGSDA